MNDHDGLASSYFRIKLEPSWKKFTKLLSLHYILLVLRLVVVVVVVAAAVTTE